MEAKLARAGLTLGREEAERLKETLRRAPRVTTLRVNTLKCGGMEEALEHVRVCLGDDRFKPLPSSMAPGVIEIASVGPFVVEPAKDCARVVVSLGCAKAVLRGAQVFAPGVLAILDGVTVVVGGEVSVWTDPTGSVTRGSRKSNDKNGLVFLGNGRLEMGREGVFQQEARGISVTMMAMEWLSPPLHDLGPCAFPQNLPSILTVQILAPHPGSTILDMCAAPGGKTSHLAAMISNQGCILAFDKNKNKVEKLRQNMVRLGATSVNCFTANSAKLLDRDNGLSVAEFLAGQGKGKLRAEQFDHILLDPPCTGFGQRPDFEAEADVNFEEHASYQEHLFETAHGLLRPGGTMVYSTCSISGWENEALVERVLAKFPDLRLEQQRRFWPQDSISCDSIGFFLAHFTKLPII